MRLKVRKLTSARQSLPAHRAATLRRFVCRIEPSNLAWDTVVRIAIRLDAPSREEISAVVVRTNSSCDSCPWRKGGRRDTPVIRQRAPRGSSRRSGPADLPRRGALQPASRVRALPGAEPSRPATARWCLCSARGSSSRAATGGERSRDLGPARAESRGDRADPG